MITAKEAQDLSMARPPSEDVYETIRRSAELKHCYAYIDRQLEESEVSYLRGQGYMVIFEGPGRSITKTVINW